MYPKKVTIKNEKLKKLILEKEELILKGRTISEQIEKTEVEMAEIDAQIQELEKMVDISDLDEEARAITEEFNVVVGRMDTIKTKIYERMKKKIDPTITKKYEETKKKKEDLENERNKIALNAQKRKDKIVPLARKELSPYLENEYDDFNSIVLEGDELVGSIFNHKLDWEKSFKRK